MSNCPCCKQPTDADHAEIELGEDGLAIALAMYPGLGPPLVDHSSVYKLRVRLDGVPADHCVGFDRSRGILWRYQVDTAGHYMRRDDEFVIERVKGVVTLETTD